MRSDPVGPTLPFTLRHAADYFLMQRIKPIEAVQPTLYSRVKSSAAAHFTGAPGVSQ
jgi:hypothetical protein